MAELKVNLLVEREGETEPFNGFTDNELAAIKKRLSQSMSAYYANHSEECIEGCH